MKKTIKIKIDPEIADVRRWREQAWKEAGGTIEGLLENAKRFESRATPVPAKLAGTTRTLKRKIKIDPEIADVRRWREKVWKEAGETFEGLMERARRFESKQVPLKPEPSKPSRKKTSRKSK